jgi:heme/copper-type cytochrome/quinol oxidase subunit 2
MAFMTAASRLCRISVRFRAGFWLLAAAIFALALFGPPPLRAAEPVTLSLTLQDHKFVPAEVHAPADTPIVFRIKNLNTIVSEFESSDLHFEKIVPVGTEATVYVRPQRPGRYNFFDDFHRDTQGFLVVP